MPHAHSRDASLRNATFSNASLRDAGLRNAGFSDASLRDAGLSDAGLSDAGFPYTGFRDAGLLAGVEPVCAVVLHADGQRVGSVADADRGPGRRGMAGDIREGFLDYSIRRPVDRERYLGPLALEGQRGLDPGPPRMLDQLGELLDALPGHVGVLPQRLEGRAQITSGRAAGIANGQ
ncbi:pentapeptide repeat-containing protein [Paractinoplanes abujensis]|uniref:pentapeptide repeat-containing protein n=1 Tax=Paractinoplanes abujensis TaxID=882441 RepID=UPI0034DAF0A8